MKKLLSFLILLLATSGVAGQALNSYKYAVVPTRFEWQSKDNQYRLSTMTKSLLTDAGFVVFYDSEHMPAEIASDRCNKVYVDVERGNSLMNVKLTVVMRDCTNKEIFRSKTGDSKEKNFETAYHAALREAFSSFSSAGYSYTGPQIALQNTKPTPSVEKAVVNSPAELTVEAVATGYIIIDNPTSNIVLRLFRTGKTDLFIASSKGKNGVAYKSGNTISFEYYEGDVLRSESFSVTIN